MRAPELAAKYIRGMRRLCAYLDANPNNKSSFGPKEPSSRVMSLAITTISRPFGYSGVYIVRRQATIPISFFPGSRTTSNKPGSAVPKAENNDADADDEGLPDDWKSFGSRINSTTF